MEQTLQRARVASSSSISRPVLFLHIPKTGGTSLLLTLRNTFGDNRVRRIHQVDEHIGETIEQIVEHEFAGISCLAGHLPLHLFDAMLDRFHPFTVLREPVARVLSVYRFIRSGDPLVPARLGLRPDFSLDDFLNWGHPEVFGQVNNGMVRMLCGNPRLFDPGNPMIWEIGGQIDTLEQAVANLERIDFGLAEDMAATQALARACWGVPYNLSEYRENATAPDASGDEVALIHRVVEMNTADIALYHRAREIFHARVPALPDAVLADGWNPLAVFVPEMNREASIGDIPGRQGFHEFEADGFAWLHAHQPTVLHFAADRDLVRLRLRVYCVIPTYPAADIAISINAHKLQVKVSPADDKWRWVETEHFETRDGLNRLTIKAPLFIPANELEADCKDSRKLSIALEHVEIGP